MLEINPQPPFNGVEIMAIVSKKQSAIPATAVNTNVTIIVDIGTDLISTGSGNPHNLVVTNDITGTGFSGTVQVDFSNDQITWFLGRPNILGGSPFSAISSTGGTSIAPTLPINWDTLGFSVMSPSDLPYRYVRFTFNINGAIAANTANLITLVENGIGTMGR